MKLKAQLLQEEIPTENIDELEQTLKDIGFDKQKIRDIIDPLKTQVETTTTPTDPLAPLAPEEPATGVQPNKNVLQPGMTMKRLQQKDAVEEIFEDKVEEYLDSGEEFDVAVHKAHKHLDRVVDYLELHGQRELREPKGPAKHTMKVPVVGDSLYDRLSMAVGDRGERAITDNQISELSNKFTNTEQELLGGLEELLEVEGSEAEKIKLLINKLADLVNTQDDLENALVENYVDTDFLYEIIDEVKQVALDAQGGISSPIDLGEWLY